MRLSHHFSFYVLRRTSYALLSFVLLGCGGLQIDRPLMQRPGDVLYYGGNEARTADYHGSIPDSLVENWEIDLSAGTGKGTPLLLDSMVLGGNLRGDLYAYKIRNGKSIGSVRLTDAVAGSPIVDRSIVVIPTSGSEESLIAYNLSSGRVMWRVSFGEVEMSPLLIGRRVYFGTLTGKAYCVEAVTGGVVWSYTIPENTKFDGFRSAPSANDSLVYFGADNGTLYALHVHDGSVAWQATVDGPIESGSALARGTVIVASTRGTIAGFDAGSGKERWTMQTGSPIFAPPALRGDTAIIGGIDGYVRAISAASGKELWQTKVDGPVNAGAAIAGDKAFFGTLKKRFYALRLSDGGIVFSKELDGRVTSPALVGYDRVLIATDEYTLYCFGAGPG